MEEAISKIKLMEFLGKARGFIFSPIKTFDDSKADTLRDAIGYCSGILVIAAILFTTSTFFFPTLRETMKYVLLELAGFMPAYHFTICFALADVYLGVEYFIFLFLPLGIFYLFMVGVWLHLWVYIAGGRKGINQTYKVALYAYTPVLIAWTPVVFIQANIMASIWTIFLTTIGIRQLHQVSTGRAIIACMIAYLGDLFYTFDAVRCVVGW
jgi:hypothetical protein